jgi:hypothetical protein
MGWIGATLKLGVQSGSFECLSPAGARGIQSAQLNGNVASENNHGGSSRTYVLQGAADGRVATVAARWRETLSKKPNSLDSDRPSHGRRLHANGTVGIRTRKVTENGWRSFSSKLTLMCRGHAISSGVKPHLFVFQKAKYSFKKRPQFFLVVFIGGEFAESHPLLLICQIGQISCGISSCMIAILFSGWD